MALPAGAVGEREGRQLVEAFRGLRGGENFIAIRGREPGDAERPPPAGGLAQHRREMPAQIRRRIVRRVRQVLEILGELAPAVDGIEEQLDQGHGVGVVHLARSRIEESALLLHDFLHRHDPIARDHGLEQQRRGIGIMTRGELQQAIDQPIGRGRVTTPGRHVAPRAVDHLDQNRPEQFALHLRSLDIIRDQEIELQFQAGAGLAEIKARRHQFRKIGLRKIEIYQQRRLPFVPLAKHLEKARFRSFREVAHRAPQPHVGAIDDELPRGARAMRLYLGLGGRDSAGQQRSEKE